MVIWYPKGPEILTISILADGPLCRCEGGKRCQFLLVTWQALNDPLCMWEKTITTKGRGLPTPDSTEEVMKQGEEFCGVISAYDDLTRWHRGPWELQLCLVENCNPTTSKDSSCGNRGGQREVSIARGNYILHELLADGSYIFAEGGAEHHALFLVGRHAENFLNITPHICKKNRKTITMKMFGKTSTWSSHKLLTMLQTRWLI